MIRIDPHVHLRDWGQQAKETLVHGLTVAVRAGLQGVVEMPNTDPALTAPDTILRRIDAGTAACDQVLDRTGVRPWHALYAGVTAEPRQIRQIVNLWRAHPDHIIGLKLFAGHSTGNMGLVTTQIQRSVYQILVGEGFDGLLAVHAEKESLLDPTLWDSMHPASHSDARPPIAETASVQDQIRFAREAGFTGTLHICHLSCPETLEILEQARTSGIPFRLTCGVTPHHTLLDTAHPLYATPDGILLKMNPPLRTPDQRNAMFQALCDGRIDWIESDHAPHTLADKMAGASGIPALAGIPLLVAHVKVADISQDRIDALTGGRFIDVCQMGSEPRIVPGNPKTGLYDMDIISQGTPEELLQLVDELAPEYPWNPWETYTDLEHPSQKTF